MARITKIRKSKRLHFIDQSTINNRCTSNSAKLIRSLCQPNISKLDAQKLIRKLTNVILTNFFSSKPQCNFNKILVPILRAGLPMWVAANHFFKTHESSFISCQRVDGSVIISWLSKPQLKGKEIILLDTILATGKTIADVCSEIKSIENDIKSINIIACYASPESIEFILKNECINNLFIGMISESVDKEGFLIPPTYGDVGDKCFGKSL